MTLPDGRAIDPDQVLGRSARDALVHVGDAGRTDDLVKICQERMRW